MQQARDYSAKNRMISPAQPAGKPHSRPEPERFLKKVKLLSIMIGCFVLSLVVVAQYSSLVVFNFRMSNARTELSALKEETRSLELEAAQLGSIGRIERIAREELGLVDPEVGQLKVITAERDNINRPGE